MKERVKKKHRNKWQMKTISYWISAMKLDKEKKHIQFIYDLIG